jgi:hypothetical protein
MKKKIALIAAVLFVSASVEVFSFGIGVRGNFGWNSLYGAAILFSPNTNLHFGGNWYLGNEGFYLGATGDYWIINNNLTDVGNGTLDFYAGLGLFAQLGIFKDFELGAGVRIPLGLDLDFDIVDIFLEVVPQLGLSVLPKLTFYPSWLGGALGIRVWIDN